MEVLDDMKLAKIISRVVSGSGVGVAAGFRVSTLALGAGNIVSGVTKNFFAAAGFRLSIAALQLFGIVCANIVPFLAWPFAHGWMLGFVAVSLTITLGFSRWCGDGHAGFAAVRTSQPIGAAIFAYMLLPVDGGDPAAGRNCVAGDVLSTGEIAARIGVRRSTASNACAIKYSDAEGFPSVTRRASVGWRVRGENSGDILILNGADAGHRSWGLLESRCPFCAAVKALRRALLANFKLRAAVWRHVSRSSGMPTSALAPCPRPYDR